MPNQQNRTERSTNAEKPPSRPPLENHRCSSRSRPRPLVAGACSYIRHEHDTNAVDVQVARYCAEISGGAAMSNFQHFDFNGQSVRVQIDETGREWFCATDVVTILGYNSGRQTITDICLEKGVCKLDTLTSGGKQALTYLDEPNIYRLITRSHLPKAKEFERWVFEIVLPTIRKTGAYIPQETFAIPKTYAEALRLAADLTEQNEQLQPKAEFYDHVTQSDSELDMHEVAKILDLGLGRNNLMDRLRKDGILMHANAPYQIFVNAGYFRLVEMKYETLSGEKRVGIKTVATQKGLDFIRRRYGRKTQLQLQLQ
jgi:anti-repressor protein